ncbi:MAG: hypothetical protein RRY78_01515 [Clostridia bacterium]
MIKKTVLLFYSKDYNDKTVSALEKYFVETYQDCDVVSVADEQYFPMHLAKRRKKETVMFLRNMPTFNLKKELLQLKFTEKARTAERVYKEPKPAKNFLTRFFKNQQTKKELVKNIMARFDPDIVVCLDTAVINEVCRAQFLLKSECKILVLSTEFGFDKNIVNLGVDYYFVQNEDVKLKLLDYGFMTENIKVIGFPLDSDMLAQIDKQETKQIFGIDNLLPCILLMGGRFGSGHLINAFKNICELSTQFNIIALTGNSKKLKNRFNKIIGSKNLKNIYVIEEIDNMARLFSLCDIFISSPYSIDIYRSLLYNKPVILIKGCTSVEQANREYILGKELAKSDAHLKKTIESLAQDFDNHNLDYGKGEVDVNSLVDTCDILYEFTCKAFSEKNHLITNYDKNFANTIKFD